MKEGAGRNGADAPVPGDTREPTVPLSPSKEDPRSVPTIGPDVLAKLLQAERGPLLIDVRPTPERAFAHLEPDTSIPLEELPNRLSELPKDRPIVVYCHVGGSAPKAVAFLRSHGFDKVVALEGGLDSYSRRIDPTVPRYREPRTDGLIVQQFPNVASGCLAYLIADLVNREAIIIDPGQEIGPYLHALDARRLALRGVVETHTHADHRAGHAALHERTGAPIWLSHRSAARYPHRPLNEGDGLEFGTEEIVVLETPGHTLDHLTLRVADMAFTGDTLLPGSCGRTDLAGGDPELLWESLRTKILPLPDDTEVLPAHYGPLHDLPPPARFSSNLGFERATNEALRQPTLEAFRTYMTEGWPPKPPNFDRLVRLNLEA